MLQTRSIECILLLSGVAVLLGSLFFQAMLWFYPPLLRSLTSHSRNQSVLNFTRKYCGWAINIKQARPESRMPYLHVASHLGLKLEKNGAKNKIQLFPPQGKPGSDLIPLTRPELMSPTRTLAFLSCLVDKSHLRRQTRTCLCVTGQWLAVLEEGIPSI